jgi:peptidoglycan/xylan/chitin deacetylase (PgdA/CDA1 family)
VDNPLKSVRQFLNRHREDVPGTIASVVTAEPVAALTFDDGPHPEYTPRVLDVLGRFGARGTFFMVGEAVQKHRDIVERVAREGHAIGNHTWDHPSLPNLPGRQRRRQVRECRKALAPYGRGLFRPPYGAQSWAISLEARWLGYKVITWNVTSRDWLPLTPEAIADRMAQRVRPGCIVLLHDAIYRSQQPVPQYRREPMLLGLNLFLERKAAQFKFVTVAELMRLGPTDWRSDEQPEEVEAEPNASA